MEYASQLDGREAKVLKVTAHIPETLIIDVPKSYYKDDGRVELHIRRLTGDYAAACKIALYEGLTGKGGSPTDEKSPSPSNWVHEFKLLPSYPNPARNVANISYTIKQSGPVSLKVYNIQGQLVRTLVESDEAEGAHTANWDCRDKVGRQAANGVYLYRLVNGADIATGKLTILK